MFQQFLVTILVIDVKSAVKGIVEALWGCQPNFAVDEGLEGVSVERSVLEQRARIFDINCRLSDVTAVRLGYTAHNSWVPPT
jgi:hypothetical protein